MNNVFVHCPVDMGSTAYGPSDSFEILKVEGLWLSMRNQRSGQLQNGMHWGNMHYSGIVVQNAQAVGAKEMLHWLIANAIDVSKADAPEHFEELYRLFVANKRADRLAHWGP